MVIKALVQGISIKQPNVEPLYQSIIVVLAAKSEQILVGTGIMLFTVVANVKWPEILGGLTRMPRVGSVIKAGFLPISRVSLPDLRQTPRIARWFFYPRHWWTRRAASHDDCDTAECGGICGFQVNNLSTGRTSRLISQALLQLCTTVYVP